MVRSKQFYKSFLAITFGIALQNLLSYGVNLMDNVMLGAYSETALSGAALANQLQYFLQCLVMGIGEGVVILGAQYWGQQRLGPIKKIIGVGLYFGLAVAAFFFLAIFLFPYQILGLLTTETAVIEEAANYLRIICFSYLIFAATNVLVTSLRSIEIVKIGYLISASTLLLNTALNYCLIYGNFGAPRLGIRGAAIATLLSRVVELCIVLWFLKFHEHRLCLRLRDVWGIDRIFAKDYTKVVLPVILSQAQWGFAMTVQMAILGHMGAAAVAASSIATILSQVTSVVSLGSGGAASVIIGRTVGENDEKRVRAYTYTLQLLFLIIGLLTALLLLLVRAPILQFYAISPEAKAFTNQFVFILAAAGAGTAYQWACLCGIVRGGGDTRFVLINDLIFMWGIVIPASLCAAFAFRLSPAVVFFCLKSDQITKCVIAFFKVNSFNWMKKVTRDGV